MRNHGSSVGKSSCMNITVFSFVVASNNKVCAICGCHVSLCGQNQHH